jgi:hypothetical protein
MSSLYRSNLKNCETNQKVPDDLDKTTILDEEDDDEYYPSTIEVYRSEFSVNLQPYSLYISGIRLFVVINDVFL